MSTMPKIHAGLGADCAEIKGVFAFDKYHPKLDLFYTTIYEKLLEQNKACVEVSNWMYIAEELGPPMIITGATGYAFYQYLFGDKTNPLTSNQTETQQTKLETTKDKLQNFLSTTAKAAGGNMNMIRDIILKGTGIPVAAINENAGIIIAALQGLSFTLAVGWTAYKIKTYSDIKSKADNYLKIFQGDAEHIKNMIGNIAEYTTLRFSSLISQISSADEVGKMADRLLKQFAFTLGKGKSYNSKKDFVIRAIAPLKSQIIDEIWKERYFCLCPRNQDKTLTLKDGRKITYAQFATQSPLILFYEENGKTVSKEYRSSEDRTIDPNLPAQIVITEGEVVRYGFHAKL